MNPIIGVGEILWDLFPDGRRVPGGAPFNFISHAHKLGHEAYLVSRVGNDELGQLLRAEVSKRGLSDKYIQTDDTHPTGTVRVTFDNLGEPRYVITDNVAWDHLAWESSLEQLAEQADAICYGTLALRNLSTRDTIDLMLEENRKSILPSFRVLDVNLRHPRPSRELIQSAIDAAEWVKVNRHELSELAMLFGVTEEELVHSHQRDSAGHESVWLVTKGGDGAELITPNVRLAESGQATQIVNPVGAGDAFLAAFVCHHLADHDWASCLHFANAYATQVCAGK